MTPDRFKPLLDREFLKAELHSRAQARDAGGRLVRPRFFVETWDYRDDGTGADNFQLHPKFPIAGAGQSGNRGEADLAIGSFGSGRPPIPQIVCEFKDIKSGLDKPQPRKGNTRSPVYQARDYLWNARRGSSTSPTRSGNW